MGEVREIRLTVPGSLKYRDVAVRAVREACALVRQSAKPDGVPANSQQIMDRRIELQNRFDLAVVSAFGEIYNNIAMHAYDGSREGDIDIRLALAEDHMAITITDQGVSFDISTVPPPEELPEGGMGIHLARAMLDELSYQSGPPNVWRLVKYSERDEESTLEPSVPESPE